MTQETLHADYTILIHDATEDDDEILAILEDPARYHGDDDPNSTGVAWYGTLLARHADQPRARQFELATHDQVTALKDVRNRISQLIAVLES
ncbi:hypothetical protein COO72_02370 [Bifidobacterium callitrichos]|nr:hypothetical protein COO72_02370 [Bifidobacterium callitrichos]